MWSDQERSEKKHLPFGAGKIWTLPEFLSLFWLMSQQLFATALRIVPRWDSSSDSLGWDSFRSLCEPGFPGSRGTRKEKVSGAFDPSVKITLCLFNWRLLLSLLVY